MTGPEPTNDASIATLKRIKEAEQAAEGRLAAVRADVTGKLSRLRDDAQRALQELKVSSETARTVALAKARSEAEAEAAALLAEGRKAAELIEMKATQTVAAKREQVLAIVLGALKPSDGS